MRPISQVAQGHIEAGDLYPAVISAYGDGTYGVLLNGTEVKGISKFSQAEELAQRALQAFRISGFEAGKAVLDQTVIRH